MLEEAYEVAAAIDALPATRRMATSTSALRRARELGDLLFQFMIHSVLAAETGAFTIADVARGICDKLVRRHPHVFGDTKVSGAPRW